LTPIFRGACRHRGVSSTAIICQRRSERQRHCLVFVDPHILLLAPHYTSGLALRSASLSGPPRRRIYFGLRPFFPQLLLLFFRLRWSLDDLTATARRARLRPHPHDRRFRFPIAILVVVA
jgi:hypothetical protein